jgi:hypothetical protein
MHMMPGQLDSAAETAGWMAQAGCEAQALTMLDAVR